MSLKIESTDPDLTLLIDKIQTLNQKEDEYLARVSLPEFREIRDKADAEILKVDYPPIQASLVEFQKAADKLVDTLQLLGKEARKVKLSTVEGKFLSAIHASTVTPAEAAAKKLQTVALKRAVEFQLTYVVMAYKNSVEVL